MSRETRNNPVSEHVRELVDRHGFAFIGQYRPSDDTRTVAADFGPLLLIPGMQETQVLLPRSTESAPLNIYSGNFGLGQFPLHSDLAHWARPPRYFLLRCVSGDNSVATRLVDARDVVEAFGELPLRRALVRPRRSFDGVRPLLRLCEYCSGRVVSFRWDELFLVPASREGAETFLAVGAYLATVRPMEISLRLAGDTLLIDNWRILHGRSAVPESARHRRIERVYLRELK